MGLVVYKLGGSLLDLPDLRERLTRMLADDGADQPLLVVGGGAAAEIVRQWGARHALAPDEVHWLALRAMSFNEALVQSALPGSGIVTNLAAAGSSWHRNALPIVGAQSLLHALTLHGPDDPEDESDDVEGGRLPETAQVTSDSIAAWIARYFQAERLVMLKSVPLPRDCTLSDAVHLGLVDEHFPHVAPAVPRIDWCNLRGEECRAEKWLHH